MQKIEGDELAGTRFGDATQFSSTFEDLNILLMASDINLNTSLTSTPFPVQAIISSASLTSIGTTLKASDKQKLFTGIKEAICFDAIFNFSLANSPNSRSSGLLVGKTLVNAIPCSQSMQKKARYCIEWRMRIALNQPSETQSNSFEVSAGIQQ